MRAYHFLSEKWALDDLKKERLKISSLDDLNDPFEWSGFANPVPNRQTAWRMMISDLSKTTGIICFSRNWWNPLLWAHFADKHKGMCLGFDIPERDVLREIEYRDKPLTIQETGVVFDSEKILFPSPKS